MKKHSDVRSTQKMTYAEQLKMCLHFIIKVKPTIVKDETKIINIRFMSSDACNHAKIRYIKYNKILVHVLLDN